tara:strand:- start:788 stop:1117 length:330 start_codon:yes stop_codon:yes gene_type:complete
MKPIGEYDPQSKTYTKWVYQSHRLWKAGGAFTVDKMYLDEYYPECEWVMIWERTHSKSYIAPTSLIRELSWRDSSGRLHTTEWGEQYALPFMYWREAKMVTNNSERIDA